MICKFHTFLVSPVTCADACNCYYHYKERVNIYECISADLRKLPGVVPMKTNWIVLKNNTISEICGSYKYSSDVSKLELASNSIESICPSFINSLLESHGLTEWDLSNNLLQSVAKDIQNVTKKIKLGNNPFVCNCDILQWMPDWLEYTTLPSGEHVVTDYKNITCNNLIQGKEKKVHRLKEEDLGCNSSQQVLVVKETMRRVNRSMNIFMYGRDQLLN